MLQITLFRCGLLCFPLALHAGQVYGSVSDGGRPVAKAAVEVACAGAVTPGVTADDGAYRINVPQQGQCTLALPGFAGRPSAVIFSYPNPTRYDFQLVKQPNGSYQLQRR